jgi:hypothetical protein
VTEPRTDAQSYREFFESQKRRAAKLSRYRLIIAIGIGIVLVGILIVLGSPWPVLILVTLLYVLAFFSLWRLQKALNVTEAALSDLEDVARMLGESPPPSRATVVAFVRDRVDPNDESDVPEALSAFCAGQQNSESVRAAANSAFSLPASELSVAQFFRTALVLGGLFGTVLFFALELGKSAILAGDIQSLLPGLQGALASTLTGILGSVAVGHMASAIDQVIERSIWETESLIGGPFARALQVAAEESTAVNEVQLWQQLIEEVRKLRQDTTESYAKVASDVSAHSIALQTLSTQLTELPAVQVPPQLANLEDVVRRFRDGAELLNSSATTLVNAVGALGVYAPAKTLQELDAIRQGVASLQGEVSRTLSEVGADVARTRQVVTAGVEEIKEQTTAISPALRVIEGKVDNVQYEVGGTAQGLAGLKEAAERTERSLYVLQEKVVAPRTLTMSPTAPESGGSHVSIERIEAGLESMNAVEHALTERIDVLAGKLNEMSALNQAFAMLNRRMAIILTWQEKATRAPLMKLLTLPFRRVRQEERPDGA